MDEFVQKLLKLSLDATDNYERLRTKWVNAQNKGNWAVIFPDVAKARSDALKEVVALYSAICEAGRNE